MIRNHLLSERLDVRVASPRGCELAGVDIDLIGGHDDGRNLGIVDTLGRCTRSRNQQQTPNNDG